MCLHEGTSLTQVNSLPKNETGVHIKFHDIKSKLMVEISLKISN